MRHGRAKAARKTLKFFSLNGNIRPPYKIILDGNFLAAIVKQKVPIHERFQKTLQNESFTMYTCRSALDELNSLPGEIFQQARQFGLDECEILEDSDIPCVDDGNNSDENDRTRTDSNRRKRKRTNERDEKEIDWEKDVSKPTLDICNLVTNGTAKQRQRQYPNVNRGTKAEHNPQGYMVATQDEELSGTLRSMPNVPQMRLSRGVLLLESPSAASRRQSAVEERGKQMSGGGIVTESERAMMDYLRERRKKKKTMNGNGNGASGEQKYQQRRGQKKAKGPNPLSCKKKKSDGIGGDGATEKKAKKRRRRK